MRQGSPEWWEVVQSSPMYEAENMLRHYKTSLLEANPPGSATYINAGIEIQRINAEIHRYVQIQNRATLRKAIGNVCPEFYEQIVAEAARLEAMMDTAAARGKR